MKKGELQTEYNAADIVNAIKEFKLAKEKVALEKPEEKTFFLI